MLAETPSNHQQDHEAGSAGSPEDARHDGDAHLETVHLVGNMPVSVLHPYMTIGLLRPASQACFEFCILC